MSNTTHSRRRASDQPASPCSGAGPYGFSIRNVARPPKEFPIPAGYYCIDTFTPLNQEIGVRAGLALMMAFVSIAALLGVETILGAFIAGALFSFVFREKRSIESKLSSIGFGFFVPIFFIDIGMGFDIAGVFRGGLWGALAFLAWGSLVSKVVPMVLLLALGLRLREALASLLLAAPLTLLVAISRIGLDVGIIDKAMSNTIVLFAVGGGVLLPILFRFVLGPAREPQATVPSEAGATGSVGS